MHLLPARGPHHFFTEFWVGFLQIFPWPQQVSQLVRHFQLDLTQRSSLVRTRLSSSSQNEQKKSDDRGLGAVEAGRVCLWYVVFVVPLSRLLVCFFIHGFHLYYHDSFTFIPCFLMGFCQGNHPFFQWQTSVPPSAIEGQKSPDKFTCCQALAPLGVQQVLVVSFTALPNPARIWGNAFVRRGMWGCWLAVEVVLFFSGLKISGFKIQAESHDVPTWLTFVQMAWNDCCRSKKSHNATQVLLEVVDLYNLEVSEIVACSIIDKPGIEEQLGAFSCGRRIVHVSCSRSTSRSRCLGVEMGSEDS